MTNPATKTGLRVYKSLYNLEQYANTWFMRLICPNLSEMLDAHHANLNELRKELGRDLPTSTQCEEIGIPPISTQGGPGGNK